MALNADNVMSSYRPFGHHWLDSAIQESLLPGSPWQLIYDKLSQVLAKRIQPELSDRDKRAAIFDMLGPGFLQKYLSKWTWDKPMQDVMSPDEKRLTTQTTQLLLKEKLDQAATDCGYLVSKKTGTSSSLTLSSPDPVQVPEEVIDTITQVDAIFRAGMQRYLVQEGMKVCPSSDSAQQTKNQLTHLHEVNQDHRTNNSAQPNNHDVNPNHRAASPLQGDIPNCWGKTSDLLGSSVCAILRRDPSRLDEVCRKLMGRQLPGSLRYKIWNEIMLRNYKEMHQGEKRSEWFLRQNFARTVMRGKAELGITMTTNSPINGLLQTAVQEKYSSTPCLLKHRGQGSFAKHVQEALNIVYVFDRSYQPYYIHWIYPLQLALMEKTQANTQGPDDVPYELALQLYLLRSHTFPSWSQILAVAQNVMLTIERKDPEFFNHLMQCSKTNVKLDPKDFLVHQIHEEQQKTSIQDDAVTMVTGSDEDRQMLASPVMFLRKWLGEGFVGVCDTQAVLFIWDQCFMSGWSSEVLSRLCLSLIMLLRKNFMEMAQDYHVMKQIFSSEPCRLYTLDIQKAFQHLQSEGSLTDIPSLNRRPLVRTERLPPPSPSVTLDPSHYAQLLHSSPIDLTNIQLSPIPVHTSTITPVTTPIPKSIPTISIAPPTTKATPSATPHPTDEATPPKPASATTKATPSEAASSHHQSLSSNVREPIDKASSGSVVLGSDSSLQEEGKDGFEDSIQKDEYPVWVPFKPGNLPALAPKEGFEFYIDCVRFIPDNASIVKVTVRFITGTQNMTLDLCALPDMTSLARCPTFMYRARFEGEIKQLLELMVWTVDRYTHQLVVMGTCLINVYNQRTKKLNIGGHQMRLRSGYPASHQPILPQSLDHLPPIPGCTLLLRLLPHSEEFIEAPPYSSGFYQSDACKPTESEINVIEYYKTKLDWIKTVRDAAMDLARIEDYKESSATPDVEHDRETSSSQQKADTWSKITREELETWMLNRLQTMHHPSEGLPPLLEIDRCIDYERGAGVAIKIRTAFGLQAENCYSIVLSRLLPGPKASQQMSESGDNTRQSGSFLTKEMDLDSRMNAPRWNDKAKVLRPVYDEQSVLLLQFFGLEVIYKIDPSGRTKGVVKARNNKAGLSLDNSSYRGWGLLPVFDRNCVIQGTFIIPIFQNNNDKPFLKGLMDAASLESWMRVSLEKKLIKVNLNHPSAIVSMWDAHYYQGQHTPLPRRDYFLHLAGDFNKFSGASQDKTGHPLNQIVLRSLPSAVQSEGTSGQKYLKEKQNFERSLHSIATDLVEDALLTTGQAPLTS